MVHPAAHHSRMLGPLGPRCSAIGSHALSLLHSLLMCVYGGEVLVLLLYAFYINQAAYIGRQQRIDTLQHPCASIHALSTDS
jgi:hypothetical protein